jgi:pimeloyl-ACP methyl ester carboxylesterase
VLLVPVAYKPATVENSVAPLSPWADKALNWLVGSDFVFWVAMHVARDQVIKSVMATPPEQVAKASAQERARVDSMLDGILPVSARARGLRNEAIVTKNLKRYALEAIRAPTLLISARDDGYGTYANAEYTASQIAGARFIDFEQGGHMWVGHDEEVQREIVNLVLAHRQAKP